MQWDGDTANGETAIQRLGDMYAHIYGDRFSSQPSAVSHRASAVGFAARRLATPPRRITPPRLRHPTHNPPAGGGDGDDGACGTDETLVRTRPAASRRRRPPPHRPRRLRRREVTTNALENSVSVAALVLTTEALIVELPAKESDAQSQQQMGDAAAGMGGMDSYMGGWE